MKKISLLLLVVLATSLASCSFFKSKDQGITWHSYPRTPSNSSGRTAWDVYGEMQEAAISFNAKATTVVGTRGKVTWGAEKEASSSLITRVMGPTGSSFKDAVEELDETDRKKFLKDFFNNWTKDVNGYRTYIDPETSEVMDLARDVLDDKGNAKTINLDDFKGLDYDNMSLEDLESKFSTWIDKTENRPFSFIKPTVRRKLFNGGLPGIPDKWLNGVENYTVDYDSDWLPNFGKPQKHIDGVHSHGGGVGGGWEINFKPMDSYGEFQEQVLWFRTQLKNQGVLFQQPGHQRMVFASPRNLNKAHLAELYKMGQALIVIEGIAGKTGIESSNYKDVHADDDILSSIRSGYDSGRGVVRVDRQNRFGSGTRSIEFRAGTKDARVMRFIQSVMGARVATNDFSGMTESNKWTLVGEYGNDGAYDMIDEDRFVEEFGLSRDKARKAATKLRNVNFDTSYMAPLWNWYSDDVPFIDAAKRTVLKDITKDWLESVAAIRSRSGGVINDTVKDSMRSWVKASRLDEDVRRYMAPSKELGVRSRMHQFRPRGGFTNNMVDVNKVDLGIEYSAKFPVRIEADFEARELADGRWEQVRLPDDKLSWIRTRVDMTVEEKEALIEKMANDISEKLGGERNASKVVSEGAGGHGHGFDIGYEIKDAQGRKWRVEWDGIGRTYTTRGNVVEKSLRAGSVEVVTPKFQPNIKEMNVIFEVFEENNSLPYIKAGGGHVNVDLAAFDGKPKEMARFLAAFHEHRSIIAMMFQDLGRAKSAEAIDISPALARQLKNFDGTEDQLKKLLYNEQYFNTRVGRKTRYAHLDMSAYYQDIIPEKFISEDFDISNPDVKWRPQFRVDPKIRKAEFRLFNAPRDAYESALQIKLVRALMHKALNSTDAVTDVVQNVTHEEYLENPKMAADHLKKLCDDLGLKVNDYKVILGEAISNTDLAVSSNFYRPLSEKLEIHPKFDGFERAIRRARSASNAITSEGKVWNGVDSSEAAEFQRLRKRAATINTAARNADVPSGRFARKSGSDCAAAIRAILDGAQ